MRFREPARAEDGFTVPELLVVMLIIGVLVAIAIPTFSGADATARSRACAANLRLLDGAVHQWASGSDQARSASQIDSMELAQTELQPLIHDFSVVTQCPGGGTISVAAGDFRCSVAAHNYDQ